jgi:peptidyl-tRNA hydrolase, PTH1 family
MATFPLRLIVGLGNPGTDYARTRHNAGFWFVDELARRHGGKFRSDKTHQGERARIRIDDDELELFKPLTFMNRSGLAVRGLADYFQISAGETLVAHDEIDLSVGTVRLKIGGGAGGHNGLKDVIAHLGDAFLRLRFGVGHPGDRAQVTHHVLRRAPQDEEQQILECVQAAIEIMPVLLAQGPQKAMTRLHTKKSDDASSAEADGDN